MIPFRDRPTGWRLAAEFLCLSGLLAAAGWAYVASRAEPAGGTDSCLFYPKVAEMSVADYHRLAPEGAVVHDLPDKIRRRRGELISAGAAAPVPAECQVIAAKSGKRHFRVRVPSAGFLLLDRPWHPSWRVHVYGGDRTLVRANGDRMGFFLEPGEWTVRLSFGAWRERAIEILFWGVCAGALFWAIRRVPLPMAEFSRSPAARVSFDVSAVSFGALLPLLGFLFYLTYDSGANLSHEDPGRDLYVVWRITEGEWPVRDFQWQNGLLALLYYAGCFKAFGVSALTLMSAYKTLQAGACLFVFLAARRLGGGPLALAAALVQFSLTDPWHSYNHIAVTFLISLLAYLMIRFHPPDVLLDGRRLAAILAVAWGVAQCKITMGFATLAVAAVFVIGKHAQRPVPRPGFRLRAFLLFAAVPLANLLPYLILLSFQPVARWPLCLGVGHGGKGVAGMAYTITPEMLWKAADHLLHGRLWHFLEPYDFLLFGLWFFGLVVAAGAFAALFRWRARPGSPFPVLPVTALAGFALWGHEFVGPRNVATLAYHLSPLFMVVLACLASRPLTWFVGQGRPWPGRILFLVATLYCFDRVTRDPIRLKAAHDVWGHPRCGLRVPESRYMDTVARVTEHLERTTRPDEEVAAIPRGSLYLFLAGRKRATWLEEMHIQFMPPEEEARVISELREKRVRTVLYSNLARYIYFPGNNFGEDFALDLARVLKEDYVETARIPGGELLVFGVNVHAWDFNYHQILFLERK